MSGIERAREREREKGGREKERVAEISSRAWLDRATPRSSRLPAAPQGACFADWHMGGELERYRAGAKAEPRFDSVDRHGGCSCRFPNNPGSGGDLFSNGCLSKLDMLHFHEAMPRWLCTSLPPRMFFFIGEVPLKKSHLAVYTVHIVG